MEFSPLCVIFIDFEKAFYMSIGMLCKKISGTVASWRKLLTSAYVTRAQDAEVEVGWHLKDVCCHPFRFSWLLIGSQDNVWTAKDLREEFGRFEICRWSGTHVSFCNLKHLNRSSDACLRDYYSLPTYYFIPLRQNRRNNRCMRHSNWQETLLPLMFYCFCLNWWSVNSCRILL